MLKNNNQPAVRRISMQSLKHNKTRNLFAILAVILTTFMFTTVFSIGASLAENLNTATIRMQGTKTSITLAKPDKKQIEQVKKAKNLNAAGISISAGTMTSADGKSKIALSYYDKTEFEENFTPAISDVAGAYPSAENELMLPQTVLENMKIKKPVQGMEIVLSGDSGKKTFRLSGWFTSYVSGSRSLGFVSKAYIDNMGLTEERDGVLCLSAKTGRQDDLREELLFVDLRDGQEFKVGFDVQAENLDHATFIIATIGLISFIIVLSGYLLIYNVMYISVTKDIRFYGMLKTIGTSPSQIKKIVKMQTARFSVYGIPVGILLGTLASFIIIPLALQAFQSGAYSTMPSQISFHPLIYVGTILFAVITVSVSSRKPAKFASKVSAVEALKYNGQNTVKIRPKKSTNGGKIYKMAFRNVFREKKRTLLVFASLFMGTIAFLSVDTFLGSMKLENYINFYLPDDYTIHTITETDKKVNAAIRFAKDLEKTEGVTEVSINYTADAILQFDEKLFRPFLENARAMSYGNKSDDKGKRTQDMIDFYKKHTDGENAYSAPVIAVSSQMIKKYNKFTSQKMDIDRFEKGEICLIGNVQTQTQADRMKGKKITLTGRPDKKTGADKKSLTIEIGSCIISGKDHGINIDCYWQMDGAPGCILISRKALEKFCPKTSINNIIVNCDKEKEGSVTAKIKQLTSRKSFIRNIEIKSKMISQFQSSMMSMNFMGSGISIVLLLIGAMNFINVMLTGVYTRRGELAVMESIGMTKKQVKRMLVYEGIYYGLITLALILSFGNAIIYTIAKFAQQIADYAVFHYPVAFMCAIATGIMAVCMFVPVIVYQSLPKENVKDLNFY